MGPAEWDAAVARLSGSVYMTFDWLRTWWTFYGKDKALRIFLFTQAGASVGIMPFYLETLRCGPCTLKVARLVGANIPPKVFDLPLEASVAAAAFEHILEHLRRREACDLISLGPVSALHAWAGPLQAVCSQRRDLVSGWHTRRDIHSVFHLPATMEEYFAALSKNERKNRRKYELRLLGKEYETCVDVVSGSAEGAAEFERFAQLHREQWKVEGKTGHFGAWPRALAFHRALVRAQGDRGRLRFIRILANDEVVASQYTFAFSGRYFWELPARAIAAKWDRFSLGPTGIVTMIGQAIQEGITRVEGGLAHYDYKVRLGAREYEALTFRLVGAGVSTRVRFALLAGLRQGWLHGYHKIWYRRLMPRLPSRFWRPQAKRWLQLDF